MPTLSKSINDALNAQIALELSSAHIYLSMSAYSAAQSLPGAAHWLRLQWTEELGRATKLIDYIGERGGKVTLGAIDEPVAQFDSPTDLFQQVLAHEKKVTVAIYEIYGLCISEGDYVSLTLLQWYANEQVEEESSASEVLAMLSRAGDSGPGILLVDRHLAQRAGG